MSTESILARHRAAKAANKAALASLLGHAVSVKGFAQGIGAFDIVGALCKRSEGEFTLRIHTTTDSFLNFTLGSVETVESRTITLL